MSVRIYVEGGGPASYDNCRKGFSEFFKRIVGDGNMPRVIACGSRDAAYKDFCQALKQHTTQTNVLLVDSEDEIVDLDCWVHLTNRDKWPRPSIAAPDNAYLMVRCMESWFLADKDALVKFYGRDFKVNALPNALEIESVSKTDIEHALDQASKPTTKGRYHKVRHGFDILASLDPAKVSRSSPHAKRLIDFLASL